MLTTVNKIISKFQKENILSKSISNELKIENLKTPHFYLKSYWWSVQYTVTPWKFLNMQITNSNQQLKKSHPTSKTQPTFSEKLIKQILFSATPILYL